MMLQVKAKYSNMMVDVFRETFCWLPLAHVLNQRVFVVHGGLFAKDGVTLEDLRRIDRFRWVVVSASWSCLCDQALHRLHACGLGTALAENVPSLA